MARNQRVGRGNTGKDRALRQRTAANSRGVTAIRRVVEEEYFELFGGVQDRLTPEVRGSDRLFTPQTLTVTVIGFSRFNKRLKDRGPATAEILEKVPSIREALPVTLGKLSILGSGNANKLAFELHSPELEQEVIDCETAYRDAEFALMDDYNADPENGPMLHCSIAWIHRSNIGHHGERRTLARYNNIARVMGEQVMLSPPIDSAA